MKLVIALSLLVAFTSTAFASYQYACVKNDGAYIVSISSELWDNTSKRFYYESKQDLLIGQTWCTNTFHADKGDYVKIKIEHWTGFENRKTCSDEAIKVTDRRIIVTNGTTYNYWCHTEIR